MPTCMQGHWEYALAHNADADLMMFRRAEPRKTHLKLLTSHSMYSSFAWGPAVCLISSRVLHAIGLLRKYSCCIEAQDCKVEIKTVCLYNNIQNSRCAKVLLLAFLSVSAYENDVSVMLGKRLCRGVTDPVSRSDDNDSPALQVAHAALVPWRCSPVLLDGFHVCKVGDQRAFRYVVHRKSLT